MPPLAQCQCSRRLSADSRARPLHTNRLAVTAHAQTDDERFVNAVDSLGIETAATAEELPAVGHHVCDMLTAGLVGNPNPVPAVRGVVTTLAGNGMSKEQAVGLMRASSAVYCPQFARFMGR